MKEDKTELKILKIADTGNKLEIKTQCSKITEQSWQSTVNKAK